MYVVYNGQLVFTADRTIVDQPFDRTSIKEDRPICR